MTKTIILLIMLTFNLIALFAVYWVYVQVDEELRRLERDK